MQRNVLKELGIIWARSPPRLATTERGAHRQLLFLAGKAAPRPDGKRRAQGRREYTSSRPTSMRAVGLDLPVMRRSWAA